MLLLMLVVNLESRKYKSVNRDGVTAVIINKGKILLLKRASFPLMSHKGVWSFLTGGRERKERHIETAYREIKEEINVDKSQLKLILKDKMVTLTDPKEKIQWNNRFFIFQSKTRKVKLDLENRAYKWVTLKQLQAHENVLTDYIPNRNYIFRLIKSALK